MTTATRRAQVAATPRLRQISAVQRVSAPLPSPPPALFTAADRDTVDAVSVECRTMALYSGFSGFTSDPAPHC